MIEEEETKPMAGPAISVKPDVMIFKPYDVAPMKSGGPASPQPIHLQRGESVQGTPLEPEEFRPPTYIKLKPEKQYVLDEFGDPPLLDGNLCRN